MPGENTDAMCASMGIPVDPMPEYWSPEPTRADLAARVVDLTAENARMNAALLILGAYLLDKGEAFRIGEGAELLDAYSAAITAPALPDARAGAVEPVAVRVKPLVWDGFVAGNYRIEVEKGGIANLWRYSAEMVENEEPDLMRGGYLTLVSLDELKAAAQADHEARILAALEITPACTATDGPASACVYRAP